MKCCCTHCDGLERVFDDRTARRDLEAYHRNGPDVSTRLLLDALRERGVSGLSLIDIGGGIGAIQHELVVAGVEYTVDVDVAAPYLHTAQREAERRGYADRAAYHQGDFVALASQIEPADIVTLDRVLCCYPDMPALVGRSADHARHFYGVVFPHDHLPFRAFRLLFNGWFWLTRNPYRFYLHSTQAVEALLHGQGFQRVFRRTTFFWQVMLYERV